MKKRVLSLILAFAMAFGLMPAAALAGDTLNVSENSVSITADGTYTVTGTTTTNHIAVAENVNATITLQDVSIKLSDGGTVSGGNSSDMGSAGTAAISLAQGAKVTLILEGSNELQGGAGRAAIEVMGDKQHIDGAPAARTPATLTIRGSGSLAAQGGNSAAGIGGSFCMNAGIINIESGTVTATAGGGSNGDSGAGIGGGHAGDRVGKAYGSFCEINISGGVVTADGVRLGAGIGAGAHGKCDNAAINITGGIVTAKGGTYRQDPGDGIGLAHGGSGNVPPEVKISGNAVVNATSINAKNSSQTTARTTINGGIVFNNSKTATMTGDVTLPGSFRLESGYEIKIPAGTTLTVPASTVLTVDGTISGEGTVLVKGGEVVGDENITCTYVPGDYILTLAAEPARQTYQEQITLTAVLKKYADGTIAANVEGTVTFSCGETVLGTAPLENGTAALTTAADQAAGDYTVTAVVTVAEIPVTGRCTITVTKADQSAPTAAVSAAETAYGSITLNAITEEGHGAVQYAYVEKPAEGEADAPSNWQTSTALTGLKAGTTYIVYARFAGNDCYNPSPAGAGVEITTAVMTPMAPPTLAESGHVVTYNAVTLLAPDASAVYPEAVIEYRMGTRASAGEEIAWGEWKGSKAFTGLSEKSTCYFQARYAIAEYAHYSEASAVLELTTPEAPVYQVSIRVIGAVVPGANPSFSTRTYNYNDAAYQNWLKTQNRSVKAGTTAKDLIAAALTEAGFTYSLEDTVSVTAPEAFGGHGLAAKQHGTYSRWYITVYNGDELVTQSASFDEYELQDGDKLIFHYVFNTRYETAGAIYASRHPEIVQGYLKISELTPAELAAVKNTVALIDAIGRVTPDSGSAIIAARTAYNGLTAEQKEAVTNYAALTAAEAAFIAMGGGSETKLPTPTLTVGNTGLYSVELNASGLDTIDADYTLVYSASVDGKNWGAWQTSNAFEKLLPAETYYFRAMAQTGDWTAYGDSDASAAVTASTLGGDAQPIPVTTADGLKQALETAATDGTLTVIDFRANIVINDLYQEFWTVDVPDGANILLTTSNGSAFFFNECGQGSSINLRAGTTVTVRDMTLSTLSHYYVPNAGSEEKARGNTPGNAWHSALRMHDSSAVVNLDNVKMYNDSTSTGVVQSVNGGTLNLYSGAYRGLGYDVLEMKASGTVNLIPNGDLLLEGTAAFACEIHLLPMLATPVSGAARASAEGTYTALAASDLTAGTVTFDDGLRIHVNSEATVPPVELAAPVVLPADDENAATADVTYTVTDDTIVFTVDRDGKADNAVIQLQSDQLNSKYSRSFGDVIGEDKTGLTNTFTYTGLSKDTGYVFTITYASLDSSCLDAATTVTVTTSFTPEQLAAPALGDQVEKTETTITLTAPAGSAEDATATLQYRISADGETWSDWQDSPLFEDLTPNTTYFFQARYQAVHKYWLDSEGSEAVTAATKAPALEAPVLSGADLLEQTSITLTAPAGSAEDATATLQYRISADGESWSDWQDSPLFENLTPNTAYSFQARYVASGSAYLDSAAGAALVLTTARDTAAPTILVSSGSCLPGGTIDVTVTMENNPGIITAILNVDYDSDKLELISLLDGGVLNDGSHSPDLTADPYNLAWEDALATSNNTANGVLATLTFKVKAGAEAGESEIVLTYDPDNVYDYETNNVAFQVVNGTVKIVSILRGDVDNDGKVDAKDVTVLRRHVAEWDGYDAEDINYPAADVDQNGEVNAKDATWLARCVAHWDGYTLN